MNDAEWRGPWKCACGMVQAKRADFEGHVHPEGAGYDFTLVPYERRTGVTRIAELEAAIRHVLDLDAADRLHEFDADRLQRVLGTPAPAATPAGDLRERVAKWLYERDFAEDDYSWLLAPDTDRTHYRAEAERLLAGTRRTP